MTVARDERIEVDVGSLGASAALPAGGAGPATRVPDLLWRIQPGFLAPDTDEVVAHPGPGHAFENSFHPMFSDPDATAKSWRQALGFLARTLEG